jgi:hypothetical protein
VLECDGVERDPSSELLCSDAASAEYRDVVATGVGVPDESGGTDGAEGGCAQTSLTASSSSRSSGTKATATTQRAKRPSRTKVAIPGAARLLKLCVKTALLVNAV